MEFVAAAIDDDDELDTFGGKIRSVILPLLKL
jgi:hypothetical protein